MNSPGTAPVTPERIMQLSWGYVPPLVLEAAVRHHIFDILDAGPKNIEAIHQETGASKRGLTAVVNALVGLNLLTKDKMGTFSLTPESAAFLVSTKPAFQGGAIQHASKHLIPKWLHLTEIVASGKPFDSVNQETTGGEFFQNLVTDIFPLSYPGAQTLAQHLFGSVDFGAIDGPIRVLDLAAGSGVWGIALAQTSDRVACTAVDWPEVIPVTRSTVARFGLTQQFSFVEGDLLHADFGQNYAVATLGHILHSEGEERSRALLAKVSNALSPGGTIAIAEFLVNTDRTGPVHGLFFALNMLVNTDSGDTYSFEEISGWLAEAGFVHARTLDAPGPSPLILATKG